MANRLSATDARRVSPAFFIIRTLSISVNVFPAFALFFACSGSENFLPAPNQHRTFSYLRQEPGNTGSSLLLAALPHIHSKTACRGFKSFCPCQKDQHCIRSAGLFRNGSGRSRGARSVARGAGRRWRPSSADRAGRRDRVWPKCYSFFRRCSHPLPPVLTRSHPLPHPKRTRFCLFQAFSGAFLSFSPFWTCKIFGLAFVHSAT